MPDDDDDTAQRLRKLIVEHAETRWLILRYDNDVQEIRTELRARFDSVDGRLRSLTQLVGHVLDRLPEQREPSD